jgi:hypothetical protein
MAKRPSRKHARRTLSRPKGESLAELNAWLTANHDLLLKMGRANCLRLTGKPTLGGQLPYWGNGGFQFEDSPFMPLGDMTIGKVILYHDTPDPNGDHEEQHTYQSGIVGLLYLPLNLLGGILGLLSGGRWDGPCNFMEWGPSSQPPEPFPGMGQKGNPGIRN